MTLMTARVGTTTTPLPPPGRACTGDPHPKRSSPPAAVEAWSAPVRRPPAHHRFRTPGNWKVRPRTPKLRGVTPASTAQRVWADLQHAGDLRPHFGLSVFPATGLSRLTPPPPFPFHPGRLRGPELLGRADSWGVIRMRVRVGVRVALSRARAPLLLSYHFCVGRHLLHAPATVAVATRPDAERCHGAAAE